MMEFSLLPTDEDSLGIDIVSVYEFLKNKGGRELSIFQGQTLYYEDLKPVGIFFLLKGKIKIIKEYPLGKNKMISILGLGSLLGISDFLNGTFYKYTAIALEDCDLLFLSDTNLKEVLSAPEFQKHLLMHSY